MANSTTCSSHSILAITSRHKARFFKPQTWPWTIRLQAAFQRLRDTRPWIARVLSSLGHWHKKVTRRKFTLWASFSTCFVVFVINLVLAILAQVRLSDITPDNYIRTLYSGDCDVVKQAGVVTHLFINLLSTLMLWASNLAMQLAAAPTRVEVNKAHERGRWLDIGVVSLHNLFALPKMHLTVWALLATSSLPIHFLYNSVVFTASHTNQWQFYVVTERFFETPFTNSSITGGTEQYPGFYNTNNGKACNDSLARTDYLDYAKSYLHDFQAHSASYKNVSMLECLRAYNDPFTYRPSLFLVNRQTPNASNLCMPSYQITGTNWTLLDMGKRSPTDPNNFYSATLCEYSEPDFFDQYCGRLASGRLTPEEAEEYHTRGWPAQLPADYCIYDPSPTSPRIQAQQQCHLQCSPGILLVVTLFNAIKCLCILWVILKCERRTLSTLGDAIASFLEFPDMRTKGFGVATRAAIVSTSRNTAMRQATGIVWKKKSERWWSAADALPWVVSLILFPATIGAAAFFIADEVILQKGYGRDASLPGLWKLGFGEAKSEAIISWNQRQEGVIGLMENLVVANVWQTLVSVLYTTFTVILTSQLAAREWASYALKSKTLRVAKPKGQQRSTYFISIPARYGLPIMLVFWIEHWLLSQSSFIIRLLLFDTDGLPLHGRTTSGFSVMPSLLSLFLTVFIFMGYIFLAVFRRYPAYPRMPLVCTNSLAISANCHPPETDRDAHLKPVQWGIVEGSGVCAPQKCSLTSLQVQPPEPGAVIFGLPENTRQRRCSWGFSQWVVKWLGIFAGP